MILPGSYANGFAPRDGQPLYPELWRGCVFAAAPCLGVTGLTLREWSGQGNQLVLTNGPTWGTISGKYAIRFDGTDDYMLCSKTMSFDGDFTVSANVQFATFAGNQIIVSETPVGNTLIGTLSSSTVISVRGSGFNLRSFTVPTLVANKSYEITLSRANGNLRLYVNGTESTTGSIADTATFVFTNIGYAFTPASGIEGIISQLQMWSRPLQNNAITLLASRLGIAYEMAPRRRASSAVQFNRRRRLLLGST